MIQTEKLIAIHRSAPGRLRLQLVAPLLTSSLLLGLLSGCASGSFSSKSSGTPTPTNPAPNANPPSLPALTAATAVNDYAGTQSAAAAAPDNTIDLHIDQTSGVYRYTSVLLPGQQTNPVPNSSGIFNAYQGFRNLGDTSGATGLPGAQYFGLGIEEPSRLAFFASNSSQAIAALVPRQSSACITPTAAATYAFMTLPNAGFNPATDPAWGTVQISASGSAFTFSGAKQYTESSAAASTSLIPFSASNCAHSSNASPLGYFIDTQAANGAEIRSFLGPTGMLVSDIQGTDQNGLPLAVPGFIGMVQPASALDLASVTGSPTNPILYRSFLYQPLNSPAVQYGFMGQNSGSFLIGVDDSLFTSKNTPGMMGGWQGLTAFTFPLQASGASGTGAFVFGSPDANDPGLFPHARFLYQITGPCPTGTTTFASGYCSSPAVAIAGQHDGKYIILVSGIWVPLNNAPTLLVLVQS